MERLVDATTGAILFRHPTLRGLPDLVLEGDGYTPEFIGSTLLCGDIRRGANPQAEARWLSCQQLPRQTTGLAPLPDFNQEVRP